VNAVRVLGHFADPNSEIGRAVFDDGTVWTDLRDRAFVGDGSLYATWLMPGTGNDTVRGGAGIDAVSFVDAVTSVTITFSAKGLGKATSGTDTNKLIDVENATGSRFDDSITGNEKANTLRGMAGDDTLQGNGGNDRLDGGRGYDTAVFDGLRAEYAITTFRDKTYVTHSGFEGKDTLLNIEVLMFADDTLVL